MNEPTTATLAFDHADPSVIAAYGLGGGTFDISILEMATMCQSHLSIVYCSKHGMYGPKQLMQAHQPHTIVVCTKHPSCNNRGISARHHA